jgi:hypothetical protein
VETVHHVGERTGGTLHRLPSRMKLDSGKNGQGSVRRLTGMGILPDGGRIRFCCLRPRSGPDEAQADGQEK